jgi:hypothetical protein
MQLHHNYFINILVLIYSVLLWKTKLKYAYVMKIVAQRKISQTNVLVRAAVQLLVSDACQSVSSSWVIVSSSSACTSSPPIFCRRSTRSANMSTSKFRNRLHCGESQSDSSLNLPAEPETYLNWGCKRDRPLLVL